MISVDFCLPSKISNMQVQKPDNTSFKAIHLASVRARLPQTIQNFELYRATAMDRLYLDKVRQGINLKELMPNLNSDDYVLWQRIINMVLYQSKYRSQETILLTKDNRLCGGLKYSKNKNDYNVDAYSTWPIQSGKREPLAGKVLMLELFNLFMQDNFAMIKTCVSRCNPFNPVMKSFDLGFRSYGGDDYNELMLIKREKVSQIVEKFASMILFKEPAFQKEISLENLDV